MSKHMKHKKMIIRAILGMVLLTFIPVGTVFADTDIKDLKPNVFKDKKVDWNTDYLHDKAHYRQKTSIPKIQRQLTFKKDKHNPAKEMEKELFQGNTKENNTITAKATKLHLFSDKGDTPYHPTDTDMQNTGNSSLVVLYLSIIGAGIVLMFLILIPRMIQKPESKSKSSSVRTKSLHNGPFKA